jgi:hypothetical protein
LRHFKEFYIGGFVISINETNINIMTNDIEKAINFYETIGLEVKKRWENHYAMMSAKGLNIGLHPSEEHSIGSGSVSLGFIVDDLSEIKEILTKNKIRFSERSGKSGDFINFEDLDKTSLYFSKLNIDSKM